MSANVVAAVAALLMLTMTAAARQPFESRAFEQAQAAGKTILVDVTASWCPVCRRQQPILARLTDQKPSLVIYEVDFDRDKDALKRLRVQSQATLIVFKGAAEVGRSTGDTDPARIQALVDKGF
jgi:thiol-disulfide isomerase/thioredoxin